MDAHKVEKEELEVKLADLENENKILRTDLLKIQ